MLDYTQRRFKEKRAVRRTQNLAAFRELGKMIDEAANYPAINPSAQPRMRLSILDGGLRIGPNSGN